MKVTTAKPPNYDELNKLFKLEENKIEAVFTYGDTIHNPFSVPLTAELIRHEETHMEQQEGNPEVAAFWYKRYIQDVEFRIDMESEAYGAQYRLYCQQVKNRELRAKYLWAIAGMLAGPMYGNVISTPEAQKRIREFAEHPMGN